MKNKVLLLFISIIAIALGFFITSVNALGKTKVISEKYFENNLARVSLAEKVYSRLISYYNIKNNFEDVYPSYFGGLYISEDATALVIQVVKSNIPTETESDYSLYNEIINMDKSIKIEYVDYSFNELNSVNNYLSNYFSSGLIKSDNFNAVYIDVINNTVGVDLTDDSQIQQENFKKTIFDSKMQVNSEINFDLKTIFDSKLVTVSQSDRLYTMANLNAGGKYLRVSSQSWNYCSMGFRTRYNGKNGYVTAGHCAAGYSSFPSGTIRLKQFTNNQNYDYAFVETNSSYIPVNTLAASGVSGMTKLAVITYCPTIVTNMAIGKVGATTNYTAGKVTAINVTAAYLNADGQTYTYIKGMMKSTVHSQPGDSGAIVLIPRTDVNGGAIPLGILSGGNGTDMYFTSINNLPAALQTGTY